MNVETVWAQDIEPRLAYARNLGASVINQTSDGGRLDLIALARYATSLGHGVAFFGRDLTITTEARRPPPNIKFGYD